MAFWGRGFVGEKHGPVVQSEAGVTQNCFDGVRMPRGSHAKVATPNTFIGDSKMTRVGDEPGSANAALKTGYILRRHHPFLNCVGSAWMVYGTVVVLHYVIPYSASIFDINFELDTLILLSGKVVILSPTCWRTPYGPVLAVFWDLYRNLVVGMER